LWLLIPILAQGSIRLEANPVFPLSQDGTQQLLMQASAVSFVQDAFSHLKVIGHTKAAFPLLQKAGVRADRGIVVLQDDGASSNALFSEAAKGRVWERESKVRPNV
jgi:catalase